MATRKKAVTPDPYKHIVMGMNTSFIVIFVYSSLLAMLIIAGSNLSAAVSVSAGPTVTGSCGSTYCTYGPRTTCPSSCPAQLKSTHCGRFGWGTYYTCGAATTTTTIPPPVACGSNSGCTFGVCQSGYTCNQIIPVNSLAACPSSQITYGCIGNTITTTTTTIPSNNPTTSTTIPSNSPSSSFTACSSLSILYVGQSLTCNGMYNTYITLYNVTMSPAASALQQTQVNVTGYGVTQYTKYPITTGTGYPFTINSFATQTVNTLQVQATNSFIANTIGSSSWAQIQLYYK